VALIVTLYTNPLTIVPLYVIAFEYGRLLLGLDHAAAGITPFVFDWSDWPGSMRALGDWDARARQAARARADGASADPRCAGLHRGGTRLARPRPGRVARPQRAARQT